MSDNPLDMTSVIMNKLAESVAEIGLTLHGFMITPSPDPSVRPHMAQAIFEIDVEGVMKDPEQKRIDESFKLLTAGFTVDEDVEKRETAIDKLRETLQKGALWDDDEEVDLDNDDEEGGTVQAVVQTVGVDQLADGIREHFRQTVEDDKPSEIEALKAELEAATSDEPGHVSESLRSILDDLSNDDDD